MNEDLIRRIEKLETFIENMQSSNKIPLSIDQSLRGRFGFLKVSTKAASSEDVSINEAGAATKTVLDNPDGYLEIVIASVTYYIPIFT